MASQFEKVYRFKNTPLSDEEFNKRFQDVDLRVTKAEEQLSGLDEATDKLIARGLEQLSTQISGAVDDITEQVNQGVQQITESVTSFEETRDDLLETVEQVQEQIDDILENAGLTATAVLISPIAGIAAAHVQGALAEVVIDLADAVEAVDEVQQAVSTIETNLNDTSVALAELTDRVNGIGDVISVANLVEAAALTGLDKGDVIHVVDNGSGKWVRYQVTAAGAGTWSGVTKVVIWTQDQAPGTHGHVIADVTGLQTALDGKLAASSYTAADVLAKVKTVDGASSGLDADLWKGATFTVSTSAPSGGANGDFWYEREA